MTVDIRPLTPDRWDDFEALFGPDGAVYGCWCMYLRLPLRELDANGNAGNRRAMQQIVDDRVPGLLAYEDGRAVGWVSVAPREEFGRLNRSRITRRVDDQPAWGITCFFIDPAARGRGVATALLDAAVAHAADRGATLIEGYPVDTSTGPISEGAAFHGTAAMFAAAGFEEVVRRNDSRPIMRRHVVAS